MDQHLEHENRSFKDDVKCYRGTFSQDHIDRISKARTRTKLIIKSLDGEIEYHRGSGQPSRKLSLEDIKILVERYEAADILTERQGRVLPGASLLLCENSTMSGISGMELHEWLNERLTLASIRPSYLQFQYASYELSSSSEDELNWSPERGVDLLEWSSDDDWL